MKPPRLAATLILLSVTRLAMTEGFCTAPATDVPAPSAPTPAGHPLRGVIVAVLPEKSALLVKHEEIPSVMAAMTMLLKVDKAALDAAQKGQAITATLVKQPDGWWLRDVKAEPVAK